MNIKNPQTLQKFPQLLQETKENEKIKIKTHKTKSWQVIVLKL